MTLYTKSSTLTLSYSRFQGFDEKNFITSTEKEDSRLQYSVTVTAFTNLKSLLNLI